MTQLKNFDAIKIDMYSIYQVSSQKGILNTFIDLNISPLWYMYSFCERLACFEVPLKNPLSS